MRTVVLGLLGLVLAAAIGVGIHLVTRETIALPVVRLEQGARLAPTTATETTTTGTTTTGTTTETETENETETDDNSGSGSDDSGRGRGRGRGRGGDD